MLIVLSYTEQFLLGIAVRLRYKLGYIDNSQLKHLGMFIGLIRVHSFEHIMCFLENLKRYDSVIFLKHVFETDRYGRNIDNMSRQILTHQ